LSLSFGSKTATVERETEENPVVDSELLLVFVLTVSSVLIGGCELVPPDTEGVRGGMPTPTAVFVAAGIGALTGGCLLRKSKIDLRRAEDRCTITIPGRDGMPCEQDTRRVEVYWRRIF
jgi:hypothetical protein